MVGVPAYGRARATDLSRIEERGPSRKLFELALSISRALGDNLGVDAGACSSSRARLLEAAQAARERRRGLPSSTHQLFGSRAALGRGLRPHEASPVVSVAVAGRGQNRSVAGHPGRGAQDRSA